MSQFYAFLESLIRSADPVIANKAFWILKIKIILDLTKELKSLMHKFGDQTCHQVHFQHGIFNNFCSTIGQFNKNLFNN